MVPLIQLVPNDNPLEPPSVVWDVTNVAAAVERLKANGTSPNSFKVLGREPGDYVAPLLKALAPHHPVVFGSKSAVRAAVAQNVSHRNGDRYLAVLFSRVDDWAQDRLTVAAQSGRLWTMTPAELASDVFRHDKLGLSDVSVITDIVNDIAQAIGDRVVLMLGNVFHESTYFKALVPLIAQRAKGSVWVLFDDHGMFRSVPIPAVNREYIHYGDIVGIIAHQFDAEPNSVKKLARSNRAGGADNLYFTQREFNEEYTFLAKAAHSHDLERLPEVPEARKAPISFSVRNHILFVAENEVGGMSPNVVSEVASELRNMIADVTEHHGLSNSSPVTARKLERLRSTLDELAEGPPTEGTILRMGMMVGALEESIRHDPEGNLLHAQGSLQSLATQSNLFLNRFEAWRKYLRDAAAEEIASVDQSVGQRAIEIIRAAANSDAVEQGSKAALRGFSSQVEVLDTPSEKIGAVATLQNMLATAGASVKRQIVSAAGALWEEVRKDSARWLLTSFLLTAEASLRALAQASPAMFGWLDGLLDWIHANRPR